MKKLATGQSCAPAHFMAPDGLHGGAPRVQPYLEPVRARLPGSARVPAASPLPAAPRGLLLTMGSYLGTLAAARDLGRHGIPVILADAEADTITAHSRYVSRTLRSPDVAAPDEWLRWMTEFGQREPGFVLYPTSDDMCWLLDKHHDVLSRYYHLYQPRPGVLYEVLNKKRLHARCRALGIDQPALWTPAQALAGRSGLRYPVLVKPQTQAGMRVSIKGLVARDEAGLRDGLKQFASRFSYRPELLAHDPGLADVMVQDFHPEAAGHIYSLAGFCAPEQDIYLLRASEKVLQQPLRIGVGLCFESRPVHPEPARQLRRLIESLGYRGAFEAEFIHLRSEGRFLLIDFNTRFYGQMSFEIARGLPTPRLCYLAAAGDWAGLRCLAAEAPQPPDALCWRFRNAWLLKLFVTTQRIGGNLSGPQRRAWLEWADASPHEDPVLAPDDPAPARASRRQNWAALVRHPRWTLRTFFTR